MKKLIMSSLLFCSMMFFVAGSAFAVKPGADGDPPTNPNGFPSGEHFNLNIHGKKADFNCPVAFVGSCSDFDHTGDFGTCEDGIWKYSGSLFIPENGEGIKILVETGKSGGNPKKQLTTDVLKVTDPCAVFDGDAATFQLPPAKNGYWVFFRALAKPGHPGDPESDPSLTIEDAGVNFFEDSNGNVLFFAGTLGQNFVGTSDGTFTRTKGKSKAVNATTLFNFSGNICYFDLFDCPGVDCLETPLCCEWVTDHYENCVLNDTDTNADGFVDGLDCDDGTVNVELEPVFAYCKEYVDEPIFNIADFAQFFFDVKNEGLKLLQVRFYPIPDDAI